VIALAPATPPRLLPETPIACAKLSAIIPARVCVLRQQACDHAGTQQGYRGQASDFPGCETRSCTQGRAVRKKLERLVQLGRPRGWTGSGFGMCPASPASVIAQRAARRRLQLVGLLDVPPSMDDPPREPAERLESSADV
jgi:hypothetical protein